MTTTLAYHGHPAELIELAATLAKITPGVYRLKRQASGNGHNGYTGVARIRPTCPKPCCDGYDVRLVRYDALTVITEATP